MTSKILNNVISSRSEGDIAKLFWMCLFCPSIFLAKSLSSAVQHFVASTKSWGVVFGCVVFVGFFFFCSFPFAFQFIIFFLYCMVGVGFGLFCLHVHYKSLINKLCRPVNQSKYLGSEFLFGRGL